MTTTSTITTTNEQPIKCTSSRWGLMVIPPYAMDDPGHKPVPVYHDPSELSTAQQPSEWITVAEARERCRQGGVRYGQFSGREAWSDWRLMVARQDWNDDAASRIIARRIQRGTWTLGDDHRVAEPEPWQA